MNNPIASKKEVKSVCIVQTPAFNPVDGGVQRISWKLGKYFAGQGINVSYYSFSQSGHIEPVAGELHFAPETGGVKNQSNVHHFISCLRAEPPCVILNQMPYEFEIADSVRNCCDLQSALLVGCLNNSLFATKNNLRQYMRRSLPSALVDVLDNAFGHGLVLARHRAKHRKQLVRIIDSHDVFVLPTASKESVDELHYFVGDYSASKIEGIPNSIELPDEVMLDEKESRFLHVGRINDGQKRSDLLIPVWSGIETCVDQWSFDVVGDGPYLEKLKSEVSTESLNRIHLHGFREPDSWYRRASIFLMPSAYEGFPSVLLEAQAYGLVPIVFDSYPAVRSILNHGEDALLIPPFDTKEMASAACALSQDSVRRSQMATCAMRNASKFAIGNVGASWLDLMAKRLG